MKFITVVVFKTSIINLISMPNKTLNEKYMCDNKYPQKCNLKNTWFDLIGNIS